MGIDSQKFGLFRHAPNTSVYPLGTTLFRAGDEGHVMYAIKRGSVVVLVDGKAVDTLGEDEVFGEMALLEHQTRTATVVTLEETELVGLTKRSSIFWSVRTPTSPCN
jgi:CRP-like cAMP-binding protein